MLVYLAIPITCTRVFLITNPSIVLYQMENTRIVAMKDKDLETLKDQEVIDINSWGLLMVNGPCFYL